MTTIIGNRLQGTCT